VFVALLVVYRATMLPGLGAWDTAEAQTVPPILGTMHPTGFPAYVVLGWIATQLLAPFGEPALRMNLLSGILIAGAAALGVFVSRRLGAPALLAGAIGLAFGLAPVPWYLATAADAHALHAFLLVVLTLGLLRWEAAVRAARAAPGDPGLRRRADRTIVATAAVFGVMVANHGLSLLFIPGIALFVLAVDVRVHRRPKLIAAALGAAVGVAALLFLQLPLRAGPFRAPLVYGSPDTWQGFWEIVLARQFQGDLLGGTVAEKLLALLDLARDQLGPLLLLVPLAFAVTAWRHPRYALYSGLTVLITCVFASSYANARIDRYYLGPLFLAWTWVAAAGGALVDRILRGSDEEARADGLAGVSAGGIDPTRAGVSLVLGLALLVPTGLAIRDRWSLQDRSQTVWAQDWLDQAFTTMEPDAVVLSWWSYSTPMWYGQLVEGRRPDIEIVDDRTRLDRHLGDLPDVIEANLDTRPVYVIRVQDTEVQALTDRYTIEPVGRPGNLYRVTGRTESNP
jgi:hypothetical protein